MLAPQIFDTIVSSYRLGHLNGTPEIVTGGDINVNYKMTADDKHYLVKFIDIDNYRKNYRLDKELLILSLKASEGFAEALAAKSVPAMLALTNTQQDKLLLIDGKIILVYPFIEAQIIQDAQITPHHVKAVADILSKIHAQHIQSDIATFKWQETIKMLSELVALKPWLHLKNIPMFMNEFDERAEFIAKCCECALNVGRQPMALILTHNDMKPKNILWNQQNQPIIIDWEAAGYMPRDVDYLDTLLAWSLEVQNHRYELNMHKVKIFMQAYESTQPKVQITDDTISFVIAKWLFWLSFCINRLSQPTNQQEYMAFIVEALGIIDFIRHNVALLKNL